MKEEVEFRSLVPYVKENLIKHHELYSAQCKAEYWEENCSNALKKSGFGSDWKPDFKHTHGVDQTTNEGIRIGNKSGAINDDNSLVEISGHRLTKHKTIDDKLKFLKEKYEDYIFCLAVNKKSWKQGSKKYYFVIIDSHKIDYFNQTWVEKIGAKGVKKGQVSGWECRAEEFSASITKSMSDQLWTKIKKPLFKEFYEIIVR